jgi:hypothetical protein
MATVNTFSELQTALLSDLSVSSSSSLYPTATIKIALNRAYLRATGLFRWPMLEDAKKTSTQANINYYDIPETWRADSIWKLTVNSIDYGDPVDFKDWLYETENNMPNGDDYLWANQYRRFFIYPTPTTAGDYNISVWGFKVPDELSSDTDDTIFSHNMPECNDAIVLEAGAILKRKGEKEKSSEMASVEAKQILVSAWNKIQQEQAKIYKIQPAFDVDNFFSGRNSDYKYGTGKFS